MGRLFAGLLAKGGREVWLLDKRPERAALIDRQGVVIEQEGSAQTIRVKATADPEKPGPARLAIVCVKAYDTASAARHAAPVVGPDTDVLSLQNGLGNVEALVDLYGPERVLGGTTAQGANLAEGGRVRHAGRGETVIGEPGGGTGRAERAAGLLREAGIETRATDDLEGLVWSKVAINAAINPLTAILGVKNGALPGLEGARQIMARVADEVKAVCRARGTRLLFDDPLAKALAVAEATAENISSMLQDVRAQRRTEICQINGAVAEKARELGLEAPVNMTLALLVKAMESAYQQKV